MGNIFITKINFTSVFCKTKSSTASIIAASANCYGNLLYPALADVLGLDPMDAGVVMLEFQGLGTNGSPRLQIGDVLLKINDWEIEQVSDVADSVTEVRRDWKVTIRRGGTEFVLDVFL